MHSWLFPFVVTAHTIQCYCIWTANDVISRIDVTLGLSQSPYFIFITGELSQLSFGLLHVTRMKWESVLRIFSGSRSFMLQTSIYEKTIQTRIIWDNKTCYIIHMHFVCNLQSFDSFRLIFTVFRLFQIAPLTFTRNFLLIFFFYGFRIIIFIFYCIY